MIFPSEFLINNSYPNCFQFMIEKNAYPVFILHDHHSLVSHQSTDIHTVDGCEILKTTKWMVERC